MVVNNKIQDAHSVPFGTSQPGLPASRSQYLLQDLNPVPFTSNATASSYLATESR